MTDATPPVVQGSFLTPHIQKAQQGDRRAFDALCTEHRPAVQSWCFRLLKSEQEAEQAVQEVFLHAHRSLGSFQGECSFRSWLHPIATRTCLNVLRTKKGRATVRSLHLDEAALDSKGLSQPRFEDTVIQSMFVCHLRMLIAESARTAWPPWDALDADIFHLLFEEGVPTAREAADRLGRSENTVKYRLYRHINPVLASVGKRLKAEEGVVQDDSV